MAKVKVINKTGNPADTQVYIDGTLVPRSHLLDVDIRIEPTEVVTARLELRVDSVEVITELLQ